MHPLDFSPSIRNHTYYEIDCQFAICETCFWNATVFRSAVTRNKNKTRNNAYACPKCSIGSISLISIVNDIYGIHC